MANLYSYVPSQVKVSVFGIDLVGLAKDSFISIERIDNLVSFRKAQDGSHTGFVDSYGSYRITITLSQVSESNEFLHLIQKLYKVLGTNLRMPISIRETASLAVSNQGTTFSASDCFFETEPSSEFGAELGNRTWTLICHDGSYDIRGTSEASFVAESLSTIMSLIGYMGMAESMGFTAPKIMNMVQQGIDSAETRLKNLF